MAPTCVSTVPLSESGFAPAKPYEFLEELPPAQRYPSGAELCMQGGAPLEAYVVVSGLVKLVATGTGGQEKVVGLRPAGRIVGLASILLGRPHLFSATTAEACALSRIPSSFLAGHMQTGSPLCKYVREELGRETCDQAAQIMRLGVMPGPERLFEVLLQIAGVDIDRPIQGPVRVPPFLKHWEIAQLVGVTPQHLSVLIKDSESKGTIRREGDWLVVCDPRNAVAKSRTFASTE
jgi:CRP-like cAMP-binding protein